MGEARVALVWALTANTRTAPLRECKQGKVVEHYHSSKECAKQAPTTVPLKPTERVCELGWCFRQIG